MKKVIVLGVCCVVAGAAIASLPDPVIWFSMDSVTNGIVRDMSGNGHDLTLGPGLSLGASRVKGMALVSDGTRNTYGTFSAPALNSRTVTFWLYRNEADNDSSITHPRASSPRDDTNTSPGLLSQRRFQVLEDSHPTAHTPPGGRSLLLPGRER